jgi:hypothetical protein
MFVLLHHIPEELMPEVNIAPSAIAEMPWNCMKAERASQADVTQTVKSTLSSMQYVPLVASVSRRHPSQHSVHNS